MADFYERNRRFLKPGIKESDFTTQLSQGDEQAFREWVQQNDVPYQLENKGPQRINHGKQDYDMRGFWKGLKTGDPHAKTGIDPNDKKLHYTDYWKTPYHESFSAESKFAGPNAPTWQGDRLVGADGTVYFDDAAPKGGDEAGLLAKGKQGMYGLLNPLLMGNAQRFQGGLLDEMPMGGGKLPGQFPPAPQPGSMPQQMPQSGGFLDGLFGGGGGEPNLALLALGQGIAGGDVAGAFGQMAPAMAQRRQSNATKKWLMNKGMSPEDAEIYASNPSLLNEALQGKKRNLVNAGDGNLYDADSGEWISAPGGGQGKPTDDMREYETAKQQGFNGSFMDYMVKMKEAGRQQVNIDTGVKLPPGFRWKDTNNQDLGVEPIPGGPGEQVPAELAARVGMADTFLTQLPGIKAKVKAGDVTGLVDKTASSLGFGEGSQTYRQIQSGVDALTRMLSGAGMNMAEAAQYSQRYLPTYADDSASMMTKLDQLEAELNSTKEMTLRGRGGATTVPGSEGWTDLGGGVRIRQKQ